MPAKSLCIMFISLLQRATGGLVLCGGWMHNLCECLEDSDSGERGGGGAW